MNTLEQSCKLCGDKFTSFTEGMMNLVTRVIGGSSSDRVTKGLGYFRPKGSDARVIETTVRGFKVDGRDYGGHGLANTGFGFIVVKGK